MIPIFIKVHTDYGLTRININKIEKYWKQKSDPCENGFRSNTRLDCESVLLDVRETPVQIDNLIEKAILSRFEKIDNSI